MKAFFELCIKWTDSHVPVNGAVRVLDLVWFISDIVREFTAHSPQGFVVQGCICLKRGVCCFERGVCH